MLTTAVTLHAAGKTDIQTAEQAAEALKPIAGDAAFFLFSLGLIGTGLLAVPGAGGLGRLCRRRGARLAHRARAAAATRRGRSTS